VADDWSTDFPVEVLVGDPTTGFIDISSNIPAELTAYYAAQYSALIVRAMIRWVLPIAGDPATFDYYYMVAGRITTQNALWATGWVDQGKNVVEEHFTLLHDTGISRFIQTVYGQGNGTTLIFGNGSPTSFILGSTCALEAITGATLAFDNGSGLFYDNISLPHGSIYYQSISAPFNTPAAVGEVAALTTANMTFRKGRAYEIILDNAKLKSAVAQNPAYNLRETNLAGAILVQGPRFPITVTGIDIPFAPSMKIVNNGAADVTTSLCLTLNPSAATLVTLDAGADPAQWGFEVRDIGDTIKFVGPHSV